MWNWKLAQDDLWSCSTSCSYRSSHNIHELNLDCKPRSWHMMGEKRHSSYWFVLLRTVTEKVYFIELCDFLTVNWESLEFSAIDRPKCLTGIFVSVGEISVTVAFDYSSKKYMKLFKCSHFTFHISTWFGTVHFSVFNCVIHSYNIDLKGNYTIFFNLGAIFLCFCV